MISFLDIEINLLTHLIHAGTTSLARTTVERMLFVEIVRLAQDERLTKSNLLRANDFVQIAIAGLQRI